MSNIENQIYVKENVISPEECDYLIKGFHKHEWFLTPGHVNGDISLEEKEKIKKSTDLSLNWEHCLTKELIKIREAIHGGFDEYVKTMDHVVDYAPPVILHPWWNIQWYKPNEGYFRWHHELVAGSQASLDRNRVVAWMFNLNTVENGGGTEFKYFDNKIIPKAGQLSIFPAYYTHTHRGIVATNEDKYIATGWFSYYMGNDWR